MHLDLQNAVYLGMFKYINMGFSTVFITALLVYDNHAVK